MLISVRTLVLLSVLPLAGCIASAPGSGGGGGGGGGTQISVSVAPSSASSVPVGGTQQFTATVTGSTAGVTWALSGSTGCSLTGNALGTISGTGTTVTYNAPPATSATVLPISPCPVVITATSTASSAASAQGLINLHVSVTVSPATDTIGVGANRQYTATVVGAPNTQAGQAVRWAVDPVPAGAGAFDPSNSGLYLAPPQLPSGSATLAATLYATSSFDSTNQQYGSATTVVQPTDPLGTVSDVQTMPSCPADSNGGLANGTCYSLDVSCDGVADLTTYLKVNGAASPKGTVMFVIGSGGNGFYDDNVPSWPYGYLTVETVYDANYNTVQVSFGQPFTNSQPNGWLQGPGGVRRLACRYATVADWVYKNPKMINTSSTGTVSAPLCATGNSGGSAAVAYAAFEYGLDGSNSTGNGPAQEFTMIEPTSGPVTTRLDQGCICQGTINGPAGPCLSDTTPTSMCYAPSEAQIIDPAYQTQGQSNPPTLCSDGLSGSDTTNSIRFLSDSIDYAPTKSPAIPLPNTLITVLIGGQDNTTAVPQAETWFAAVGQNTPTQQCAAADAPHEIPSVQDGALAIAQGIIAGCQ